VPGACDLAEWNVPHAPYKHRSLLVEIDEGPEKGLAISLEPSGVCCCASAINWKYGALPTRRSQSNSLRSDNLLIGCLIFAAQDLEPLSGQRLRPALRRLAPSRLRLFLDRR